MRITIPITGSRGDVQPFIALGVGLQASGLEVCLATHADFSELILSRGLEFFPIEEGARALHETEAGLRMLQAGGNPFVFIRQYARLREPLMAGLIHACWQACRKADLMLIPTTALIPGLTVAEKLGVPAVLASLQPTIPTRFLVNCLFPQPPRWLPLRGVYSLLTYYLAGEGFWQWQRAAVNRARREILDLPPLPWWGLSPRLFAETHSLHGYSSTVIPKPRDWGANHHLTGFWFLERPADWQPPTELVDFLEAGPPPVCVGFGSMHNADPQGTTDLIVQALQLAGQRGLLLTGWGGLGRVKASADFFPVDVVPHDWLFPRVAAVVHHGGAGTTAAALRAGIPSVVVPFMADQPFWGSRIFDLGAGPRPIPRAQLTAEGLAEAIRFAVEDEGVRSQAQRLGRQLRAEDGVACAVETLRTWYPWSLRSRSEQTAFAGSRSRTPAIEAAIEG